MRYNGRRFRSKRGGRTSVKNRRRITRRRPTARNQRRQILSNQNQISAIQKTLRSNREAVTWHMGITNAPLAGSYPLVVPLTSGPSSAASTQATLNNTGNTNAGWSYTMTPAVYNSDMNRSKCFLYKQYVDFTISSGTEPKLQQFTIYLVSLQPDTAQSVYNDSTGMTQLVNGRDFIGTPPKAIGGDHTQYGVYLNPRSFKVHQKWTCNTQSIAAAAISSVARNTSNTTNQHNRFSCTVNYGGTTLAAPGDNVLALPQNDRLHDIEYADIPPHKKRFLLVFSDENEDADVNDSTLTLNSIISGATA